MAIGKVRLSEWAMEGHKKALSAGEACDNEHAESRPSQDMKTVERPAGQEKGVTRTERR